MTTGHQHHHGHQAPAQPLTQGGDTGGHDERAREGGHHPTLSTHTSLKGPFVLPNPLPLPAYRYTGCRTCCQSSIKLEKSHE